MIIDSTGIVLTPGNEGRDCLGNGERYDENGEWIECCCDECDYYLCCFDKDYHVEDCQFCTEEDYPEK